MNSVGLYFINLFFTLIYKRNEIKLGPLQDDFTSDKYSTETTRQNSRQPFDKYLRIFTIQSKDNKLGENIFHKSADKLFTAAIIKQTKIFLKTGTRSFIVITICSAD